MYKGKDLLSTTCISPCQLFIWLGKQDCNYWGEEGGYEQRALLHGPSFMCPGSEMQWLHQLGEGHEVILQNLFPWDIQVSAAQLCSSRQQAVKAPQGQHDLQFTGLCERVNKSSSAVWVPRQPAGRVNTSDLPKPCTRRQQQLDCTLKPKGCNSNKWHGQDMWLKKGYDTDPQAR